MSAVKYQATWRRTAPAILAAAALLVGVAAAAEDDSVAEGRRALSAGAKYPWYNAPEDGLRPLNIAPVNDQDDITRRNAWEDKTKTTVKTPRAPLSRGLNIGNGSVGLPSIMQAMGLGILVSALAIVLYFLIRSGTFLVGTGKKAEVESTGASFSVDRVEDLPVPVRSANGDLLSEARRCYEEGNYGAAITYLFSYELLQLDRHQCLRLAKGKTNRQYLREVRKQPELRSLFERTMIAFEDVFFGRHELERERFEDCWRGLDEFHRRLEQTAV